MSAERPKRGFGFGCRETPDIYNRFLEQLGFYRKHTATDSSSLFRVVSELQYDVQIYHGKVRQECVKFMRNNRGIFAKDVNHSYDSYVNNISRPRTYGSMLELKALALRYKANVFIFEPLTEGKWFMFNPKYTVTWRVYVGRDNHFDVVHTLEYITEAAECQAIVYQLLYTDVLGLPDVEYAVERMLHDPEDKHITYETDEDGTTTAITPDGMQLQLSKPGNTQCVLMYSHLCHFHNQDNFGFIEEFFHMYGSDEGCRVYIGDYFQDRTGKPNPLLTDPDSSCVRQLLALGITPFPYKAAKSLDPCIYRNVEYDVWQELRKERINDIFVNEKRLHNDRCVKREKHIEHPISVAGQLSPGSGTTQTIAAYIPPKIDGAIFAMEPVKPVEYGYGGTDSPVTLSPYPVQHFYIPPMDQYAVAIIPAERSQLTFSPETAAHPMGVQGCIYNSFTTMSPMPFHATAQSPLKQFTPTLSPTEPLAMADHVTVLSPTINQSIPNESLFVYDSLWQTTPQQPHYYHLTPPQQQQQQLPNSQEQSPNYQQHQRQRHQRHYQQQPQQQEIATPFIPRCLFQCVPNGAETNNRTPPTVTYDNNSYTTHQTVLGSPYWHN